MTGTARIALLMCLCASGAAQARGQTTAAQTSARPVGRVSLFGMSSQTTSTTSETWRENALNLSVTFRPVDNENRPYDYGLDLRYATFSGGRRPARTSLYEAFAGAGVADGAVWVRGGNMWLNDLGALGSIAGGVVEYRRPSRRPEDGRLRFGAFAGLEPNILQLGYVDEVRKFGGYVTYDGKDARRDTLGYVLVRDAGMTERSVLTTTNYIPAGSRFFLYQAAEFDVSRPAGQAERGLTYMFVTARVVASEHVDVQGLYQRGRSIDARGLVEALSTGRPVAQQSLTGLLYQSTGGRATFNMSAGAIGSATMYGGYYRDQTEERTSGIDRIVFGGQLANIAGRGFDFSASDSRIAQPSGTYHSTFFLIGKQLTDQFYVSADYSTSLAIIRFTPSSGITVETRPRTTRWSGMTSANLTRTIGLLVTAERTRDETFQDVRLLGGLTYRIR